MSHIQITNNLINSTIFEGEPLPPGWRRGVATTKKPSVPDPQAHILLVNKDRARLFQAPSLPIPDGWWPKEVKKPKIEGVHGSVGTMKITNGIRNMSKLKDEPMPIGYWPGQTLDTNARARANDGRANARAAKKAEGYVNPINGRVQITNGTDTKTVNKADLSKFPGYRLLKDVTAELKAKKTNEVDKTFFQSMIGTLTNA